MYHVLGLGHSGLSVIAYCKRVGVPVKVSDSRANPPQWAELQRLWPDMVLEPWDGASFCQADTLVLSPGLSPTDPILQPARAAGIEIIGDIECFVRVAKAPIVAITGTNAKGTVTTLIGDMMEASGLRVLVGGNIGTPALDLLLEPTPDYYVLELSSFQLETTFSLKAQAAVLLNLSEDHLDRHGDMAAYLAAKSRIYREATYCIANRDQPAIWPARVDLSFGSDNPPDALGLRDERGVCYLHYGEQRLLNANLMRIKGRHNALNALAALALAYCLRLPLEAMLTALQHFAGLPHRCQFVAEYDAVQWYNDSKGTNVGATLAAMQGLGASRNIILLAGGQAKGQDFRPLREVVQRTCRRVIVFGQDAPTLQHVLQDCAPLVVCHTLAEAVDQARALAQMGDIVLLSPACASLDQFQDYTDRGRQFVELVQSVFP